MKIASAQLRDVIEGNGFVTNRTILSYGMTAAYPSPAAVARELAQRWKGGEITEEAARDALGELTMMSRSELTAKALAGRAQAARDISRGKVDPALATYCSSKQGVWEKRAAANETLGRIISGPRTDLFVDSTNQLWRNSDIVDAFERR